jgi:hypothetical protein
LIDNSVKTSWGLIGYIIDGIKRYGPRFDLLASIKQLFQKYKLENPKEAKGFQKNTFFKAVKLCCGPNSGPKRQRCVDDVNLELKNVLKKVKETHYNNSQFLEGKNNFFI